MRKNSSFPQRSGVHWLLMHCLCIVSVTVGVARSDEPKDPSLEQLLDTGLYTLSPNVESTTASKYRQRSGDASSVMHIVTAEDARTYGYRTLAEILRSLPGVYITNHRNYSYIGVRGFGIPGDYNSRVLLLIDGERINENIYDGAYLGNEFLLDVDLIDRVEYAPGAGSAIYGNNAFFGVINVITKRASDFRGGQLSAEYGGFDTYKARGTYGRRFENGTELLLSATGFDREGPDHLYFKELDTPAQNYGKSEGLDYDRYHSAFAKMSYGAFRMEGGYIDRKKGTPTGFFFQDLNDPINSIEDSQAFIAMSFDDALAKDWRLNWRLGYHRYQYQGYYSYRSTAGYLNDDRAIGEWWNGELRFLNASFDGHRLQFGAELQDNLQQLQQSFHRPGGVLLDKDYQSLRWGVFFQDEVRLLDSLTLTAGARYDFNPLGGGSANPRVSLAWHPGDTTTVKLIYGSAFRAPNVFERFYDLGGGDFRNSPEIRPEKINSLELGVEQYLNASLRLSASLYHNWIDSLITQTLGPNEVITTANSGQLTAKGMELDAEQRFTNGMRLSLNYSLQRLQDHHGQPLTNSPTHMVKLHVSAPLGYRDWQGGLESLYMSDRWSKGGSKVGDHVIGNLSVNGSLIDNLQLSFGLYNLFNQHYADPTGEELPQRGIFQDGRSFRLKLSMEF